MKFDLEFVLNEPTLPVDHIRCFISFLKKSLQEADLEAYQALYETGSPVLKPYTFSLFLPQRKVEAGFLRLGSPKIRMTFSCSDLGLAIAFLNGFTKQKKQLFPLPNQNAMTLVRFTTEMHPTVTENTLVIRFLSPLLVLERERESRKNCYLTWEADRFSHQLKENLSNQLVQLGMTDLSLSGFELTPLKPKRVGHRVYGQLVLGNSGIYQLKGQPALLQYLLESGLGSRRSSGFGLFEIIA